MTIKQKARKIVHDASLAVEATAELERGLGVYLPARASGQPDMEIVDKDGNHIEWRDVKTVDEAVRASVPQPQFDQFTEAYDELLFSMWNDEGRVVFTPAELMERALRYRGGLVRPGVAGAPPYYLFDLSDDTASFANPFPAIEYVMPLPRADAKLQLSLDGRAVVTPFASTFGVRQHEVWFALRMRGELTSTEVGVLIHGLTGCPAYQREDRHPTMYAGQACCRKAVDVGSDVMINLQRQGRVWKDGEMWRAYPEGVWGL